MTSGSNRQSALVARCCASRRFSSSAFWRITSGSKKACPRALGLADGDIDRHRAGPRPIGDEKVRFPSLRMEEALLPQALDSCASALAQQEVLHQEVSCPKVVLGATYRVVPEGVQRIPTSWQMAAEDPAFAGLSTMILVCQRKIV